MSALGNFALRVDAVWGVTRSHLLPRHIELGGVRTATKKAKGSSRNGRDSPGQHLGVKVVQGQLVSAGRILVRQRGTAMAAGTGVGVGKDHTLYALESGNVKFNRVTKLPKGPTGNGQYLKKVKVHVSVTPLAETLEAELAVHDRVGLQALVAKHKAHMAAVN